MSVLPTPTTLELPLFNDMHVHLRDRKLAPHFARVSLEYCDHLVAMPNTNPPLNNVERWMRYREHIAGELKVDAERLLVAYKLTGETTPLMVHQLAAVGCRVGKLYPAGVTTNSADGVRLGTPEDLEAIFPVLQAMEDEDMVLSIHGEAAHVECLEREDYFMRNFVTPILTFYPTLRVVLEHITTQKTVDFVRRLTSEKPYRLAATITAHHLAITLDDVIGDLLQPNYFCKPIAKHNRDRDALLHAATTGDGCFFLGSDSAPHTHASKHNCGCAGCFTAPYLPELLATIFEAEEHNPYHGGLNRLAGFTSLHAAAFYGLTPSGKTLTLEKAPPYQPGRFPSPLNDTNDFYDIFQAPNQPLTWARPFGK